MSDDVRWESVRVLAAASGLASVGGLAALLRSGRPLSWRAVGAAVLYSGVLGVVIAALGWNYFGADTSPTFLFGVSGLAGIGGVSVVDFVWQLARNGGVNISVSVKEDGSDDSV